MRGMRAWRRIGATLAIGGSLAALPGVAAAHGEADAAPTLSTVFTTWLPDPLPWLGAILAAGLFLLGVRRVNRAHPDNPVPGWRVAAWIGGVLIGLIALVSAIDVYAEDLLWVHMVQHLLLSMVVPPLLALGAPVTLLLRVASPGLRRRLLLPALHSRVMRVVASPFFAWPLFTAALWVTHFTPLYDAALENEALHVAEHALFLTAGILFWWPVVAADPGPRRMRHPARAVYLLAQMPVGAAVGLAIYFAPQVLYPHYATLERAWGPSALEDQQLGGALMWGGGDLILLVAVAALIAGWIRAEMRRTERLERSAARILRG
jgi:putative membrane protein